MSGPDMPESPEVTLEQVKAIKARHEARLMRLPGVVGVAIGLVDSALPEGGSGQPAILVTVCDDACVATLPAELEGAPVRILTVGTLRAFEA